VQGIGRDTVIDGRYRVEHRLGSGGMADVWCVEDEQLGRRVALKLLAHRLAEDDAFRERFRREASAAAGLQHPHIVGIFDRGEWDGTPYIAMEFVSGRTLKQLVLEDGPLEPNEAIELTIQVLRALRYAHRHGIVHRDVKPQNVILDEEGEAKVADFGIAHAGASDVTETGSIVGTAQYLSPEQAQGQPVSPRSDLYSVGVMLYELLTGRVPFEASSPVSVALKQVAEQPVPPSQLRPGVPPAIEAVVLRALAKDPARRFADADEFIAALQAARRTPERVVLEPTPGEPWDAVEEAEREGRRWWLWLAALVAVAALGAGAYIVLAPKKRTVPSVVGQTSSRAAQILHGQGFEVRIVNKINPVAPRDHVTGEDPPAGSEARKGTTVTLTVSAGPGQAPVPTVKGLPRAEAERAVRAAGLHPRVRRKTSDTVPAGTVIDSRPAQGTEVDKGSDVTLVVSKGKPKVQVPNVDGLDSSTAQGELRQAGLDVTVVQQESESAAAGTVLSQAPGAGALVPRGTAVQLTVAKAPPKVPDVTTGNPSEADARATLTRAGYTARVRHRQTSDPGKVGDVLSQSPAAGERRARGTTVTIVVGTAAPTPTPTSTPTPSPSPSPTPSPTASPTP
jgi:eukaryotic-like serine/threonine-protein kinase